MNMVKISDEALAFLSERGYRAVTISMEGLGGCCRPLFLPRLVPGLPQQPGHYRLVETNGVKVYLEKGALLDPRGVEITLSSSGQGVSLEVRGMYHPAEEGEPAGPW
ncbi:MAG: hypothetical protein IMW93_05130 [Thermoanaerobacteraceae bacterium]|nr:hypothetical protein [Thermoanaerobacteraceae bacterium]